MSSLTNHILNKENSNKHRTLNYNIKSEIKGTKNDELSNSDLKGGQMINHSVSQARNDPSSQNIHQHSNPIINHYHDLHPYISPLFLHLHQVYLRSQQQQQQQQNLNKFSLDSILQQPSSPKHHSDHDFKKCFINPLHPSFFK